MDITTDMANMANMAAMDTANTVAITEDTDMATATVIGHPNLKVKSNV